MQSQKIDPYTSYVHRKLNKLTARLGPSDSLHRAHRSKRTRATVRAPADTEGRLKKRSLDHRTFEG